MGNDQENVHLVCRGLGRGVSEPAITCEPLGSDHPPPRTACRGTMITNDGPLITALVCHHLRITR